VMPLVWEIRSNVLEEPTTTTVTVEK